MQKIIGRKPVLEALNSGKEIDRVIIAYGQKGGIIDSIKISAKKKRIKFTQLSPHKFKEYDKDGNTQGVIALTSNYKYFSLNDIIDLTQKSKYPFLLMLDSIQDTHNLGAIIRTAESAGVDGVIITERNSASINETVEKTSAGAVSHVKVTRVANLRNAIKVIKDAGFWIVGTSLEADINYDAVDYKMPTAIIVGNEEKGIRKLIAEKCDFLVKIPMLGKIQSLNVSVSAGIMLYEVVRQRREVS